MTFKEKEIVNQFMANVGLYEKTFGKLLDPIARDSETEENKNILKNVFGYEDVDLIFRKRLDRKELEKKTKILFNYNGNNEGEQQPSKGIFR